MDNATHIETLAVHAGHHVDPSTGAVMPPINLSSTFERNADGSYTSGYVYSRSDNPNRQALEEVLAALEGGAAALTFASGMAAVQAVFMGLEAGAHVVIPDDVYFGTGALVADVFGRWGLTVTAVDMTDPANVAAAMRPDTQLVWIESPSNPQLKIADIAAIAQIAHDGGARCAVDNTWPTPILQRPLALGADIVMHSTTKYLGGHSDLLGGAVIVRAQDAFYDRMHRVQTVGGAVPSPFDCWLLARSIRSLPYRMRGHCANARAVATFLAGHPRIERVNYPGLPDHPGHEIAARQMSDFGGMLSIQVRGDAADALALTGRLRLFIRATSLGGVESLVEHRKSVEGPQSPTPDNLLRLSIGLEHPDDLIADLAQALGD
ncbi:MAG: PLP-dependent transferase [Caldilineaceae bacterium]|nr:PLP-dependent transferase [Caldilineaceae bacterium]